MADEALVMRATIDDRASAPLKKIHDALNNFKPTRGMKEMQDQMDRLRSSVQSLSGAAGIGGGMWGAALGAGLTGGVIAGAASAISALDGYAKKILETRHLAREIGMSAGDIKGLEKVGERFQLGKDQVDEGLKRWAETLDLIQRRRGDVYGQLEQKEPALAEQLVNEKDTKKALGLYLSFLSQIKDAQGQKQWAELPGLGGFERLFVKGPEEFKKAYAEVSAAIGKGSKDLEEQAEAFEHSVSRINEAVDKLTKRGGGPVLGWLANELDGVRKGIDATVDEFERLMKLKDRLLGSDASLDKEGLLKRRQGELRDVDTTIRAKESAPMGDHVTTDERTRRDKLIEEIRKLTEEMARTRENGGAQKMSFDGTPGAGGMAALFQNASYTGGGFGRGGGGGGGGGVAFGMRGRYSGGPVSPDVVAHTRRVQRQIDDSLGGGTALASAGPYREMLDYIARTEGTAGKGDYNASLGLGRFLPGGKEQNLTGMSLDEISRLGRYMRHQPGNPNSSALGRYQIVGDTMRSLMKRGRIAGTELFDEHMQDRMAAELARDTGGSPARLAREWASLRGARLSHAAEIMSRVGRNGDPDSARKDTAENRNFPSIRTRHDWSKASGAVAAPYPLGWNDRERLRPGRLLDAARAAGVGGAQGPMKVDTDGSVKIDLNMRGFGDNVKARASMDGIVGGITFNRGKAMPTPSSVD